MYNRNKGPERGIWIIVAIGISLLGWYYHLSHRQLAWRCQDDAGQEHPISATAARVTETPEGWVVDTETGVRFFDHCYRDRGQE
jgi:hypothetical protein